MTKEQKNQIEVLSKDSKNLAEGKNSGLNEDEKDTENVSKPSLDAQTFSTLPEKESADDSFAENERNKQTVNTKFDIDATNQEFEIDVANQEFEIDATNQEFEIDPTNQERKLKIRSKRYPLSTAYKK